MKKVFLLAILGLFLCSGQAFAGLYSVTASQDVFWNPGNPPYYLPLPANNLDLQSGGSIASLNYSILLQFDLSGITENITSVSLNMYDRLGSGTSGTKAFNAADAWTETSNYATMSTIVTGATTQIGSSSVTGAAAVGNWVTWNLTVDKSTMFSDGILSIAVKEDTLGGYHLFNSSENAANNPYLSVTTAAAPVPIPPALWLLGSGLVGLIGIRRRFKK